MDKFKSKSEAFYKHLKRGEVSEKDFERYIYGGTKTDDARDKIEKEYEKKLREYQRE